MTEEEDQLDYLLAKKRYEENNEKFSYAKLREVMTEPELIKQLKSKKEKYQWGYIGTTNRNDRTLYLSEKMCRSNFRQSLNINHVLTGWPSIKMIMLPVKCIDLTMALENLFITYLEENGYTVSK
jgi:hypothetical protein